MHCTLWTLPPFPPHSNTHCHESSENFLYKIYQVLGILPILINYCTQLQKQHSVAVDECRTSMAEDMGSILLKVGFFFCQNILSKRCLLISLNLSLSQVYQNFLIFKQKNFSHVLDLTLSSASYPLSHWLASQNMLLPPFPLLVL
jgi:hypothetical protein